MTREIINTGTVAGDGTGDPLRVAFGKVNDNFEELYDAVEDLESSAGSVSGPITTSGLNMDGPALLGRTTTGTGSIQALSFSAVKSSLSLDLVDNTSDANKPISIAVQSALALLEDDIEGLENRVADLENSSGNGGGGITGVDWGDIGGVIGDQTDLQLALDGKSAVGHTHAIDDVDGLSEALDDLSEALDGKADEDHTHVIDDVTGLQDALDAKADAGDLTALSTTVSGIDSRVTTLESSGGGSGGGPVEWGDIGGDIEDQEDLVGILTAFGERLDDLESSGGSGGNGVGGWQVLANWQHNNNVVEHSFTNLGANQELLLILRDITTTGSATIGVQLSNNFIGGFFDSMGDYFSVETNGNITAWDYAATTSTSTSAPQTLIVHIINAGATGPKNIRHTGGVDRITTVANDPILGVKFRATSGQMSSGTATLMGRNIQESVILDQFNERIQFLEFNPRYALADEFTFNTTVADVNNFRAFHRLGVAAQGFEISVDNSIAAINPGEAYSNWDAFTFEILKLTAEQFLNRETDIDDDYTVIGSIVFPEDETEGEIEIFEDPDTNEPHLIDAGDIIVIKWVSGPFITDGPYTFTLPADILLVLSSPT